MVIKEAKIDLNWIHFPCTTHNMTHFSSRLTRIVTLLTPILALTHDLLFQLDWALSSHPSFISQSNCHCIVTDAIIICCCCPADRNSFFWLLFGWTLCKALCPSRTLLPLEDWRSVVGVMEGPFRYQWTTTEWICLFWPHVLSIPVTLLQAWQFYFHSLSFWTSWQRHCPKYPMPFPC